jgi:hypothetical protein
MTFSIVLLVIFAGAFLVFGVLLVQKLRNLRSMPDEERMNTRSDIQRKLREQLDVSNQSPDDSDGTDHKPVT